MFHFFPENMCTTRVNEECWNCTNLSKYKCPKCSIKSCSLECVKNHKENYSCDGLRDKVKYVGLKKFTDMDIVNDYRLMEEVSQQVDK